MRTNVARLKALGDQRTYLLDCLLLWNHAKLNGFEADEIEAFTFRAEFRTPEEINKDRRRSPNLRVDGDDVHNCVRLKTGELKPIPAFKRPKKPC